MLKIYTKLSLRKTWLNTLAGVARGQRSFAYEKILYLIGLKYAVSFFFGQKSKTHTRLLREKTWLRFLAGVQGGRAPLPKKMFYLISITTQFDSLFSQKSTTKTATTTVTFFSVCQIFSNIISALPWGGVRGTCPPCPPLATPLRWGNAPAHFKWYYFRNVQVRQNYEYKRIVLLQ